MENLRNRVYRLLRLSERYARTDMVYATKSGAWLMSNQVVGAVISLGLSILFAHYLSKEVFGVYRYILSIAGLAAAFSLTGINSVVTRSVAQGFEGVFRQSILLQARWSIPQIVIALGCAVYYFIQGNNLYGISFIIVALCAPISGIANTYNAYLNGKKDFQTSAYYGVISNIVYFVIMAAISIYYPHAVFLVAAYFLSGTLTNVFFCLRTLKKTKGQEQKTRIEDVAYSKNLSVMNVASMVAQQIDSIAVYHFLGPAQLAIYAFSTIIPDRIRSMFGIIATAAFPKLAEREAEDQSRKSIRPKVIRLLVLSAVIILVYIIAAPIIYKVFFPQYLSTVFYSQIFSLSLLAIASNIPIPALFTQKKQKELYIVSVGLPVAKIIISIGTILMWGIWGAIIAKIVYYVLHMAVSTYFASTEKLTT